MNGRNGRNLEWLNPALLAAAFCVIVCGVLAGRSGAIIAASLLAAVPLIAVVAALGGPAARARAAEPDTDPDGWQSFREIAAELGWATVSRRHFDTRPRQMLQRVAAAALEDRAGVDFHEPRDRDRAIALIGPDLWPLLDPLRPPSADSHAPGLDPATVDRLLTRLESL